MPMREGTASRLLTPFASVPLSWWRLKFGNNDSLHTQVQTQELELLDPELLMPSLNEPCQTKPSHESPELGPRCLLDLSSQSKADLRGSVHRSGASGSFSSHHPDHTICIDILSQA